MRKLRPISRSRVQAAMFAATLLLGIGHGWAQPPRVQPSASDPFVSLDRSLSSAADRVLAAPIQRSNGTSRNELSPSVVPPESISKAGSLTPAINRVQELRPILEPILREEGVPSELAAVVLVESGGQPRALSPKGARGIWQIMPDTARRYGLIVTRERDERLDIQRSTRAAARYLRDLYGQFGDWQLTFAAYNAGEGRVQQAMNRNGIHDFSKLSSGRWIPLETRRYVPAVVDATKMFSRPDNKAFSIPSSGVSWKVYAYARPAN